MANNLIITNDGSHSIFVPEINECYHSRHGAIVEAEHVFIKNGLLEKNQKTINILEIGFGTGLNTILTLQKAKQKNITVNYHTIEPYPINNDKYSKLNFTELIGENKKVLLELHNVTWEKKHILHKYFSLTKNKITVQNYNVSNKFDVIYFDAFSPDKQPELWNYNVHKKMYDLLKENGHLVTYCAKGEVKRTLSLIGFEVITLDGPPGKRQMIRANRK